ncbi:uncharacterized protein BCR38DRAFT_440877 [Pseudomassariella vexata]|uniref:EthD domain-containing protein n=1 Tax=Pseudomassariella vexata TaxID=1141098 RepID=A0A1Y2DR25_9PEZI|nr:uncharacterized protein BCR38DRAFT_440877 [Pseudomassariella vexata]ORY61687.1 hypothetical protein BCR38DRAFT_440877 [Pseudomassariella vexata]
MPALVTVAYPRPEAKDGKLPKDVFKFDLKYYLEQHMPLVQKLWAPLGLQSWAVTHNTDDAETYVVQAVLMWDSLEAFGAAAAPGEIATQVFGDVPNFTDIQPKLLKGDIVGGWQA